MDNEKSLLCIAVISALLLFYLRHGGDEEVAALSSRMVQKLSYWYYKFSLWRDTRKIKRSYRYITCKQCGCKNRLSKKQEQCRCSACSRLIILRKKGKNYE